MRSNRTVIPLGTILFGIINLIFHEWTDWSLGLYFGELYGIDFQNGPSNYPNYIVLNSFYRGPRMGSLKILQIFLVMGLAGYYTTKLLIRKDYNSYSIYSSAVA